MISGKPYTSRGVRTVWEGVDERPSAEGRSEAYLMKMQREPEMPTCGGGRLRALPVADAASEKEGPRSKFVRRTGGYAAYFSVARHGKLCYDKGERQREGGSAWRVFST